MLFEVENSVLVHRLELFCHLLLKVVFVQVELIVHLELIDGVIDIKGYFLFVILGVLDVGAVDITFVKQLPYQVELA